MRNLKKTFVAVMACSLALSATANAAFLVNLSILGSATNGSGYSSSLSGLTAGEPVYVEVTGQLAPVSTVDGSKTITSLSNTKDGITSLNFGLAAPGAASFSNVGLATSSTTPATKGALTTGGSVSWAGTGSLPGTVAGSAVTSIVPNTGGGSDTGTLPPSSDVLWFGQLTMGSSTTTNVTGSWTSGGSGSFKINGGSNTFITSTTESGANPFVGFSGLTLTEGSATNKLISLVAGSAAQSGYTPNLPALTLTGSNGSYVGASESVTGTPTGNYSVGTFNPATDPEIYALRLVDTGPLSIAGIEALINTSGNSTGVTAQDLSPAIAALFPGYNLELVASNPGSAANNLAFDFTQDGITGVTVTGVAAVPEPVSAGIIAVGGLFFMGRRRR